MGKAREEGMEGERRGDCLSHHQPLASPNPQAYMLPETIPMAFR